MTSTGINVTFDDMKYRYDKNGKEYSFDYEVPFKSAVDGIRHYFYMTYFVTLDGTDTSIWNMCCNSGLNILVDIEDSDVFIDYIKEHCKEDAYEEYLAFIEEGDYTVPEKN